MVVEVEAGVGEAVERAVDVEVDLERVATNTEGKLSFVIVATTTATTAAAAAAAAGHVAQPWNKTATHAQKEM